MIPSLFSFPIPEVLHSSYPIRHYDTLRNVTFCVSRSLYLFFLSALDPVCFHGLQVFFTHHFSNPAETLYLISHRSVE